MVDKSAATTKGDLGKLAIQIVKLLEPRFNALEKRIDALDEKLDRLTTILDAFLKRLDDIEKDNYARDPKLKRLERWAEKVAAKTGVKLEY